MGDQLREAVATAFERLGEVEEWVAEAPRGKAAVLVIDDNLRLAELTARRLATHGFKAVAAAGWPDELPPDFSAAIIDLSVYASEGMAKRLRPVPVIAVTGAADPSSHARARTLGAIDCLTKPVDYKRLVALLRMLAEATS